jgi:rod shape-determining protein MreD
MTELKNKNFIKKLFSQVPVVLLFISVLNNFDFNYLGLKYFSFNFAYILIFYYSLRKRESLGYVLIFIAGLFNDVVIGTPMGLSSLSYLLLCGAAGYLRNITLRPSLMQDWIFFVITILILNSLSFVVLTLIFNYQVGYLSQLTNVMFTSFFYFIFSYLFNLFEINLIGSHNAR